MTVMRARLARWLVLCALVPAPATAQAVSEARVRELVGLVTAQAQQAPTGAADPAAVDLRLDEAVQRALDRNLDIAVERLGPEALDYSIAALRAAYRPTFFSTVINSSTVQLPTSQLVGGARVQNDIGTYNVGYAQQVPWFGGNFSVLWNNRSQESTNAFNTFNPQYNSTVTAQYVQPLLRNLRFDTTRQQLRVTRINRQISEVELRATVTNTLAGVRNAYYDLLYTVGAVRVARQALALAEDLVEDNKVRVEVGTLAPIDVVQAQAEAATRRQALVQAEANNRTAELALKRLIVSGTDDPLWSQRLNPVDVPDAVVSPEVDILGAVRRALESRTDLERARRTMESNAATVELLSNQKLPALDLVATYGLQGIGGTQFIRTGGLGGTVTDTIPGGYSDALSRIGRREFPTWNVQLQMNYPLGGGAADAQHARARVQVRQSQAEIRALELQVATEVTSIGVQVESNARRVDAARAARELAAQQLEAEQSKFEVGMSTNFFVVQAQRDLATAQITELRALLDYYKSRNDFDRAQQSSLSNAGISLVSGGSGAPPTTATRSGATGGGG